MAQIQIKYLLIGGAACLIAGAAIGRFTLPAKVITQVKTVEVEKKTEKKVTKDRSRVVVVRTKKADGSIVTTTTTDKNIITADRADELDSLTQQLLKQKTYNTERWGLNLMVLTGDGSNAVSYGGSVTYRLIGPFQVGAMGTQNGTFGAIFGMRF